MDFYVYIWTNRTNGKRYIGKGRGRRAIDHMTQARTRSACPAFYAAVRKHGRESFELAYIATGLDDATARRVECAFIAMYGTRAEYNLTDGGDGAAGARRSPETLARMSAVRAGRPLSQDNRRNLSIALKAPHLERLGRAVAQYNGEDVAEFAASVGVGYKSLRRDLRAAGWVLRGRGASARWSPPSAR